MVFVDAGACCCSVAAAALEAIAVLAAVMGIVVAIDGVVEGGGCTPWARTRLASTVVVGAASAAEADDGTDVPASVREAGFGAARNRVGPRRVTFVGRVFEAVLKWVGAGSSVPVVSCATAVLAGPSGLAERVAGAGESDEEVTRLIAERVDESVDPDTVDAAGADGLDKAAVPEPVTPGDDVLDPEDAVEFVGDDEDFPVAELDTESDDEDEPELDGVAEATPGDAASPTPMPKATPNAATRPIYLAYPILRLSQFMPCVSF